MNNEVLRETEIIRHGGRSRLPHKIIRYADGREVRKKPIQLTKGDESVELSDGDFQAFIVSRIWHGIKLLQDDRWGLCVPAVHEVVIDNELGWPSISVVMDEIRGRRIESINRLSVSANYWISRQLEGCMSMMGVSYKQTDGEYVILPDILGGVRRPQGRFSNFVVDNLQKAWFVDVYPLAEVSTHWLYAPWRKNYAKKVSAAGMRYGGELEKVSEQMAKYLHSPHLLAMHR